MKKKKRKIKKGNLIFLLLLLLIIILFTLFNQFEKNFDSKLYSKNNYINYKCPDCNVIIISIDALRADHLGCYGYERNTSPNIDKFAKESFMFKNAYAQASWTLPSFTSMFTSKYPTFRLNQSSYTTARSFKEKGYITAAFTEGGYVSKDFGFDNGFDYFNDRVYGIENTYKKAEEWLIKNHKKKFFLWLHTYEVNSHVKRYPLPYGERDPKYKDIYSSFKGNFTGCFKDICGSSWLINYPRFPFNITKEELDYIVSLYDEQILFVDFYFQEMLYLLNKLKIDEKTIIIFHSDHGEEFLEHGIFRHGGSLYNPLLHVPLLIKIPNEKGNVINDQVRLIDLFPTLIDVSNLTDKKYEYDLEGINLFFDMTERPVIAIRGQDWQEISRMRWVYENFILDVIELNCSLETNDSCFKKLIKQEYVLNSSIKYNSTLFIEKRLQRKECLSEECLSEDSGYYIKRYFFRLIECNNKTYGLRILNTFLLHNKILEEQKIMEILDSLSCSKKLDNDYNFEKIWFNLPKNFKISRIPPKRDIVTGHYKSIQASGYKLIINKNNEEVELYDISKDKNEEILINDSRIIKKLKNILKDIEMGKNMLNKIKQNISNETYEKLKSLGYIN